MIIKTDSGLCDMGEVGWPMDYDVCIMVGQYNHNSALAYPKHLDAYLAKGKQLGQ